MEGVTPDVPRKFQGHGRHKSRWDHGGKSDTDRGYGWDWQKVRDAFVREHPVCVDPFGRHPGRIMPAEQVDHVIPLARGGPRLDPSNLVALCARCHRYKTAKESNCPPPGGVKFLRNGRRLTAAPASHFFSRVLRLFRARCGCVILRLASHRLQAVNVFV